MTVHSQDAPLSHALVELTSDIVASFVSHNTVAPSDLVDLIANVHQALVRVAQGTAAAESVSKEPAVPVKKSVQPDFLICLEDGKKFKSLKRHLLTRYNLTPQQYREKWGLPADYPMVAPNYAATRSALAKTMGLGVGRTKQRKKRG
jgi:predicted transcriptional regulator